MGILYKTQVSITVIDTTHTTFNLQMCFSLDVTLGKAFYTQEFFFPNRNNPASKYLFFKMQQTLLATFGSLYQ